MPEALMDELRAQKALRKAVKNMGIQRVHDFMRIALYESLRIKAVQILASPEP